MYAWSVVSNPDFGQKTNIIITMPFAKVGGLLRRWIFSGKILPLKLHEKNLLERYLLSDCSRE
jgi:hypothetical protein